MHKKKRNIVVAACLLAIAVMASAASWDGSAMMGGYGDFPPSGYYAACNSFPRNTAVEVLNLENGRTVTVIVTGTIESSGVFMMLSVGAANALGLQSGSVARIRASEPRSAVELAPSGSTGASYDLDFNPRLLAAQELKRLGYDLEPSGKATVTPPPVASIARPSPTATLTQQALVEPATQPVIAKTPLADATIALAPEEPSALEETPEPLASAKPKPVRTIVLPQLPLPLEPVAKSAEPSPAQEATPDATDSPLEGLPVPDETPIRVSARTLPRLYDGPELLPDVSTKVFGSPRVTDIAMSLSEPVIMDTPIKSAIAPMPDDGTESGPETAVAIARHAPAIFPSRLEAELAWPELEADELPQLVFMHLSPPAMKVPATSLAEGEILLTDKVQPATIVLETPAFDAAETVLSLDEADVLAQEVVKPIESIVAPASTEPEFIVALEPTTAKPPVLEPATSPLKPAAKPAVSVTPSSIPSAPVALGTLQKGRYYIQVGVYGSEAAAKDIATGLGKAFPPLIEKSSSKGKDSWKVYVGPLSRDESGVALVRVRALGYKDAFVKSGS